MKLYYFNPHTYAAEYFVTAENKTLAFLALIDYLKGMIETGPYKSQYKEELNRWTNVDPNDPNTFPGGYDSIYTLDEFEPGIVVYTELS